MAKKMFSVDGVHGVVVCSDNDAFAIRSKLEAALSVEVTFSDFAGRLPETQTGFEVLVRQAQRVAARKGIVLDVAFEETVVEEEKAVRPALVMVWVQVAEKFYVRRVMQYNKAKVFTNGITALGFNCGVEHNFKGRKMSTKKQVAYMYAQLRKAGYTLSS